MEYLQVNPHCFKTKILSVTVIEFDIAAHIVSIKREGKLMNDYALIFSYFYMHSKRQ